MRNIFVVTFFSFYSVLAAAQVTYPFEIKFTQLQIEGRQVRMAFMDIAAGRDANGKTVLLLHGKNFNGFYWKNAIPIFTDLGYRVIVPDQVGWGQSDHPNIHYSFHLLAANTKQLLDSLGVSKLVVVGHSMGGMLATRFTLMFPQIVEKLVLENPIGLEDYKTFVPWQPLESLYQKEKKATYESYHKYQESYYPSWNPAYEPYVQAQAADLNSPNFEQVALANAITYQMIYEQPVVYEFSSIRVPTLLIIGQADRTIVGKDQLTDAVKAVHGQYPELGKKTQAMIPHSELVELDGIGHIPHNQDIAAFRQTVTSFLGKK